MKIVNSFIAFLVVVFSLFGVTTAHAERPASMDCTIEKTSVGTVISWDKSVQGTDGVKVRYSVLVVKPGFDYVVMSNLEGGTVQRTWRYNELKPEDKDEFDALVNFTNRVIVERFQEGTLKPSKSTIIASADKEAEKKQSEDGKKGKKKGD